VTAQSPGCPEVATAVAVATAAEAGAADPQSLGRQLAVIFEGANALSASLNDAEAFTDARRAARTLLDAALTTAPEG